MGPISPPTGRGICSGSAQPFIRKPKEIRPMVHSIRTVYVVHHSHTDIGYTDLQERVVIDTQAQYIGAVLFSS